MEIADDLAGLGAKFEKDWCLFMQKNEWRIIDDLSLALGGRYEDHSGLVVNLARGFI